MRKETLRARLRERLQFPFADCMFNLIEGSYARPSSLHRLADIATSQTRNKRPSCSTAWSFLSLTTNFDGKIPEANIRWL
jgi:hypothetical protein